jgi:methyl-accepting chemotaxis protein
MSQSPGSSEDRLDRLEAIVAQVGSVMAQAAEQQRINTEQINANVDQIAANTEGIADLKILLKEFLENQGCNG